MTNPQRPRLRDVYASARPWPWRVAFPKVSSSREPAGPCLHAASCSSRSPTSVCRREAASLQALLAVQHVSEPCALSLLQPCGGQQPSATSQLACSLAQRVRRSLSCAFVQLLLSLSHPRPASALRCGGNPPLRLVTFALWAPSFSLHVAVARAYRLRAAVASRQPLSATPTLWVWVRAGMSWGARQHALLRPHAWRAACRG